jgi:deoxyribonuclease IV
MALHRARQIQAECAQIFVKNNMQWFGKTYQPSDILEWKKQLRINNLSSVFGHTGYLINLAAPPSENRDKSIKSLIQEVELATLIDLPFLVMHPGAHLGAGEEVGVQRIAEALDEVFRVTKASRVRITLENTAGQGTCLGCRPQHLAAIFERVGRPERLGVCLDTAHLFEAGRDIRSPKGWDGAMRELDNLLGLDQVLAFHLNDSSTDLGSRVDRHAHIGKGKIPRKAFRHIVNDARFREHPGCLETPKSDDLKEDIENLVVLRSLLSETRGSASVKPPQPSTRKQRRTQSDRKPRSS